MAESLDRPPDAIGPPPRRVRFSVVPFLGRASLGLALALGFLKLRGKVHSVGWDALDWLALVFAVLIAISTVQAVFDARREARLLREGTARVFMLHVLDPGKRGGVFLRLLAVAEYVIIRANARTPAVRNTRWVRVDRPAVVTWQVPSEGRQGFHQDEMPPTALGRLAGGQPFAGQHFLATRLIGWGGHVAWYRVLSRARLKG